MGLNAGFVTGIGKAVISSAGVEGLAGVAMGVRSLSIGSVSKVSIGVRNSELVAVGVSDFRGCGTLGAGRSGARNAAALVVKDPGMVGGGVGVCTG